MNKLKKIFNNIVSYLLHEKRSYTGIFKTLIILGFIIYLYSSYIEYLNNRVIPHPVINIPSDRYKDSLNIKIEINNKEIEELKAYIEDSLKIKIIKIEQSKNEKFDIINDASIIEQYIILSENINRFDKE